MLSIVEEKGFRHEDIEGIHCIISEGARMTVEPQTAKWNPQSVPEAMFSTPYMVATVAINRKGIFLDDLTIEEINRPDKRELMKKVTVHIDPQINNHFEGFTVEVTLKDGRRLSNTCDYVLGHPNNPMTWQDVEEKFWKCVPYAARPLQRQKLQSTIEQFIHLEDLDDVNKIIETLTP
jgi:2-methylcitrate dehydratase PrpD